MNYKEFEEVEKKAVKYLELLAKENIKYTLDVDGSMYFISEEDAAKAEELEKKL